MSEELPNSRQRILHAAEELLRRKSAQFVHIRDVAASAGVSPALIMRYFRSKDELVFEALLHIINARDPAIFNEAEADPHLTAERYFETCLKVDLAEDSHITRDLLTMSFWWSVEDEMRVRAALAPRRNAFAAMLARRFNADRASMAADLDACAFRMMDAYVGVLRRALVARSSFEAAHRHAMEIFDAMVSGFGARLMAAKPSLKA